MKKILYLLILIFTALAFQVRAETGAEIIKQNFKETNKEKQFEIEVFYPQIKNADLPAEKDFNERIKKFAFDDMQTFRKPLVSGNADDAGFVETGRTYTYSLDYEIEYAGEDFISVNFGRSEYTGGAHGNFWTLVFNYDLKNNKKIELPELFKPDAAFLKILSDYAIADLKKQIGDGYESIIDGAGAKIENFARWNITKEGLKFSFDPYQVASYAQGGFEVTVPYEKFPLAFINPVFNQVAEVSFVDGSPPNWCRGGRWTVPDFDFKIAKVKGKTGERAYFYDDDDDCPNGENCRQKSYVIAGDEIIVNRTYGNWACGWYQPKSGNPTVGWLALDKIEIPENPIQNTNWLGEWHHARNNITITPMKVRGHYIIKGNAFWQGLGDNNIHIGEIDFKEEAKNNKLNLSDGEGEYDCRVKMQLLGKYLIVSDNLNCGGANVSFNGIYQRK